MTVDTCLTFREGPWRLCFLEAPEHLNCFVFSACTKGLSSASAQPTPVDRMSHTDGSLYIMECFGSCLLGVRLT